MGEEVLALVTRFIDDRGRCEVTLEGYGHRWLRLMSRSSRRLA